MNNDLIRRGELLGGIDTVIALFRERAEGDELAEMAEELVLHFRNFVERHPGVDAVEVVRCRNCESATHCEEEGEPVRLVCPMWGANCDEDEFCSRGERREDDA